MTKLLDQAFQAAGALPVEAQDELAVWFLKHIVNERKWDDAFARSSDFLAELVTEGLEESVAGKIVPLHEVI